MIEIFLHTLNVTVLVHQLHGVGLAKAVGRNVLRQPKRLGSALHVLPHRFVRSCFLTGKRPFIPRLRFDIPQQVLFHAKTPPLYMPPAAVHPCCWMPDHIGNLLGFWSVWPWHALWNTWDSLFQKEGFLAAPSTRTRTPYSGSEY